MAKTKQFSKGLVALLCVVALLLGIVVGFAGYLFTHSIEDQKKPIISDGSMTISFLELGSRYTGDCTFIQVGNIDILIDAGSKIESIPTIAAYLNSHMTDDLLDYVIVTHAHEDHYAGFATNETTDSIFDLFQVGTIIDFAQTNQDPTKGMYKNYLRERDAEVEAGATHYTAKELVDSGNTVIELDKNTTMTILDSKYYHQKDSSGENNHSVCTLFTQGENNYLFTGDLEAKGEKELVLRNTLPHCQLYKAGHHGSKTSSSTELMAAISPEIVCVCCCCGSPEYTSTDANQFPTQEFVDRVAPYTDKVYVTTMCIDFDNNSYTSMNGNIVVKTKKGVITMEFSNSDKILKEWEWFEEHRIMPDAWK